MTKRRFLACLAMALPPAVARADVRALWGPADPAGPVPLELPALDAPFNGPRGASFPSMSQSLWVTTDAYSLVHAGIARVSDPWKSGERLLGIALVAVTDVVADFLPPFSAWEHEEWHRAVMSSRGIASFNDVYKLQLFAETIAVSHVKDDDLVRLKAQHPADQVRLSTAGIEGGFALAHNLERQTFFADSPAFNQVLLPLLYFGNWAYLDTCASQAGDKLTDELNKDEGSDVPRRDFTGLDCTAWVYDLFRPDEPYAQRGMHPSGVGIDRYRKLSHLTAEERRYLERQARLALLNFLDPNLLALRGIEIAGAPGRAPLVLNLAVRHLPTSFGYVVRGDLFVKREPYRVLVSQQNYWNGRRYFPGVDVSLFDYPLDGDGRLTISARLALWLQPQRQRHDDTAAAAGGLGGLRLGWAFRPRVRPYLELEAKTAGWVAGNVFLDRNVSVRAGLVMTVF